MTPGEITAFLAGDPPHTAKVATVRNDGRPHVVPVWFAVDEDGSVVFTTGSETAKGRALRRDPRLSLCVDDERPPFSFVAIDGVAELEEDLEQVRRWAAIIGGRYMGADRAEEFGRRNGVPGELVVRVRPTRVISAADLAD
jgi:PPOX class probable F420-dependent enzyme